MKRALPAKRPAHPLLTTPAGLAAGRVPNATTVKAMRVADRGKGKSQRPTVGARIVEGPEQAIAATPAAPAPTTAPAAGLRGFAENHFREWCWTVNGATLCGRTPVGEVAAAIPPGGMSCLLCNIRKVDLEATRLAE